MVQRQRKLQGNLKMAGATKVSSNMLMALIMVAGLLQSALAVTHTLTWTFAENATQYDEWSSKKNFAVGDEIAFIYDSSAHDVYEVTQADLDSCNLNNPIQTYRESNAIVNLDRSGYFGFLCGFQSHCSSGNMKMNVEVAAASSPASSPAPPASVPSTTPRPMLSPPTAPTPIPPPSADASSLQTRSALLGGALVAACAAVFF